MTSTGFLLAMIGAEARKRFAQDLERFELRPSHYGALMALADLGPASQQELGKRLGIDPRNFVATIDRLEERGLAERRPHPSDRRRHAVSLTAAGERLLAQLQQSGAVVEQELLGALDPAEQKNLSQLLTKLMASIAGQDG